MGFMPMGGISLEFYLLLFNIFGDKPMSSNPTWSTGTVMVFVLGMLSDQFDEMLSSQAKRTLKLNSWLGEPFLYWMGSWPRVCLFDYESVRQVLFNKSGHFFKDDAHPTILAMLGKGLVLVEGTDWVRHRRVVNPAFGMDKLKDGLDDMAKTYPGRFKIYYVLNQPPENWNGGVGFVSKEMIQSHCPAPAEDIQ
ncbi:hypothetical protein ACJX0J_030351, partial [Zea mays]